MRHRRAPPPARDRARAPEERSLTAAARFIGSFPRADAVLDPPLPEVALVGRSNVGKSSLLNALAGARLAKTSGTPGKTRMMNVYVISGLGARGSGLGRGGALAPNPEPRVPLYVLDLPGYGYARASQADRTAFRGLIRHVLDRPRLAGVLWLLDVRREPSPDDRAMHELLAGRDTRVLAALTKGDKVARTERRRREGELRESLGLDDDQVIVTSAREGEGIGELREAILGLVDSPG